MPECAKPHLQQSRISKFSGGGPPDLALQGERREGEGRGGEREGGREGWTGREGARGGMGGWWGGEGRSTWAPPP